MQKHPKPNIPSKQPKPQPKPQPALQFHTYKIDYCTVKGVKDRFYQKEGPKLYSDEIPKLALKLHEKIRGQMLKDQGGSTSSSSTQFNFLKSLAKNHPNRLLILQKANTLINCSQCLTVAPGKHKYDLLFPMFLTQMLSILHNQSTLKQITDKWLRHLEECLKKDKNYVFNMEGFENEDYKTAQRVVEEEIVGLFRLLQKEYEYAS